MKLIIYTLAIILLGYLVQLFLPWWSIVIVAGLIAMIPKFSGIRSFFMGFIAVALLWGVYAFILNEQNDAILSNRIGNLFGDMSPFNLILLTALLGGFLGGMGALTGSFLRAIKPSN